MSFSPTQSSESFSLSSFFTMATDPMLLISQQGVVKRTNTALQTFVGEAFYAKIDSLSICELFPYPPFQDRERLAEVLQQIATNRQLVYTTWQETVTTADAISLSINILPKDEKYAYLITIRPLIVKEQMLNKQQGNVSKKILSYETHHAEQQPEHPEEISRLKLHTLLKNTQEFSRVKSKFISIASHEFRTPLSTILASADLIGRYAQKSGETRFGHHISRIKSSVRNLTKILDNFLSLDKLETGDETYEPALTHLPSLLQKIINELKPILRKGQKVELEVQLKEPEVYVDARIVQIILYNLLNNAAKYSAEQAVIYLTVVVEPTQLHLTVEDSGIGIPEADQPHVFTRFYRGQNTVNTSGAGLGLNVVEQYLQLLQGRIEFMTQVNQGTTFQVWLPTPQAK